MGTPVLFIIEYLIVSSRYQVEVYTCHYHDVEMQYKYFDSYNYFT